MKPLLIAGLCAFAAGCADISPTVTVSDALFAKPGLTLAAIGDCGAWRTQGGVVTCRGHELPEQVVGEENHAAVLDGRS